MGGFSRGGPLPGAEERGGADSVAGDRGVGDGGVGEREWERGRLAGSFTLPSKGGGAPGVPGRWRGGA